MNFSVSTLLKAFFVAGVFALVRGSVRAGVRDPSRRSFLTGTASGVGVALLSMLAAGIARLL